MSEKEDFSMYKKGMIRGVNGIVKTFTFPDGEIRGDTFYIKHLSDNFTVIDCYLKDSQGGDRSCRKNEIINEIVRESAGRISRFISTHPDDDHIRGLEALNAKWPIKNFYSVKNGIPGPNEEPSSAEEISLAEYIKLKSLQSNPIERGVCCATLNEDAEGVGSSGINFLWPDVNNEKYKMALKDVANPPKDQKPAPNNISCVIKYSVKNGATYLWMGDMLDDMQEEFWKECKGKIGPVDVLFHPHHGRESSKPPATLMKELDPQIIVIGNAPDEYLNRDNPDKTITQNRAGDIVFHNDTSARRVHVYTSGSPDNLPSILHKHEGVGPIMGLNYQGSFDPRVK